MRKKIGFSLNSQVLTSIAQAFKPIVAQALYSKNQVGDFKAKKIILEAGLKNYTSLVEESIYVCGKFLMGNLTHYSVLNEDTAPCIYFLVKDISLPFSRVI